MTSGKTIALTRWTFLGKAMSAFWLVKIYLLNERMNDGRLADARQLILSKKNLNSLILLPLTAFIIPFLRGTFPIQFMSGSNRFLLFSVLLSSIKKKERNQKEKQEERKRGKEGEKKNKIHAVPCGLFTVSL